MIQYAVAWHPSTDNLGDDLRVLAASRLLPRIDRVLDADRLDAPMPELGPEDRVVALLSGTVLRCPAHWPPEEHVSPLCIGAHFSAEDTWGVPLAALEGAGREALLACSPVGCRDDRSVRLMEKIGLPHTLTACVTLTMPRPEVQRENYVCCVDVPEQAVSILREFAPGVGMSVREMTHNLTDASRDYEQRMRSAEEVVRTYAAAQFVVTRRLHCAMVCLAIGTPVLLLYHSDYEDVTRFSPMHTMVRTQPVEAFVHEVERNGFPLTWRNPRSVASWQEKIESAVRDGLAKAQERALPLINPQEAAAWRQERLEMTTRAAEEKIRRLEQENYESLHEKFRLLLREDAAKSLLEELLQEPEVEKGLEKLALRRAMEKMSWWDRILFRLALKKGGKKTENLSVRARQALRELGWPENGARQAE